MEISQSTVSSFNLSAESLAEVDYSRQAKDGGISSKTNLINARNEEKQKPKKKGGFFGFLKKALKIISPIVNVAAKIAGTVFPALKPVFDTISKVVELAKQKISSLFPAKDSVEGQAILGMTQNNNSQEDDYNQNLTERVSTYLQ